MYIAVQRLADPVDDGFGDHGCGKLVGLADDPRRQHTATRTTGHKELFFVDIAACDDGVDPRYQIVIVLARIVVMNLVGERIAVARGAPWIRVQHNVACRRIELVFHAE